MGRDGRQLEADCVLRLSLSCIKMTDRFTARTTHATAHTSIQHTSRHITFTRTFAASAARAVDLGAARLSEAAKVLLDRRRLVHQSNEVGAREGEQFARVGGASFRAARSEGGAVYIIFGGLPLPHPISATIADAR